VPAGGFPRDDEGDFVHNQRALRLRESMPAILGNDRMFQFRGTTLVDRWISRLRFRDCYAALPLASALNARQEEAVARLRSDGYAMLEGHIERGVLRVLQAELQEALEALRFEMPCLAQTRIDPARDRDLIDAYMYASPAQLAARGLAFSRDEARDYGQVIRDFNPSTLTVYPLAWSAAYRKVWLDPFILGIAAAYTGMVPKMAEAFVRRNFPSPYRTMNHFWHRDLNHKHYMLKAFLFLSDCTLETGPHEFVAGSHRLFEPLNGRRYFDDEQVDAAFPRGSRERVVSEVAAGTVLLEDTRGLHRADMPQTGHRDLGYVTFMPMNENPAARYYDLPAAAYRELTPFQRAFVPSHNVV
jgi:hypothetical protein